MSNRGHLHRRHPGARDYNFSLATVLNRYFDFLVSTIEVVVTNCDELRFEFFVFLFLRLEDQTVDDCNGIARETGDAGT